MCRGDVSPSPFPCPFSVLYSQGAVGRLWLAILMIQEDATGTGGGGDKTCNVVPSAELTIFWFLRL
jgi:hypothetical protein